MSNTASNTLSNKQVFINKLTEYFTEMFSKTELYKRVSEQYTPEQYAIKMVDGLINNTADKNGLGIQTILRCLKIKNTYKAIKEYLNS